MESRIFDKTLNTCESTPVRRQSGTSRLAGHTVQVCQVCRALPAGRTQVCVIGTHAQNPLTWPRTATFPYLCDHRTPHLYVPASPGNKKLRERRHGKLPRVSTQPFVVPPKGDRRSDGVAVSPLPNLTPRSAGGPRDGSTTRV
ncbi:Hypp7825 [Branchiostoma lanceolatum]|uniref:Hypp7825 protein n=1 Tax=Branchiostoma lanceolatum TaxID=7740 RepID=A0A8J9Z4D3_BRALA|nr:Hypp7825 [Branchiostoma lanceolatum]